MTCTIEFTKPMRIIAFQSIKKKTAVLSLPRGIYEETHCSRMSVVYLGQHSEQEGINCSCTSWGFSLVGRASDRHAADAGFDFPVR